VLLALSGAGVAAWGVVLLSRVTPQPAVAPSKVVASGGPAAEDPVAAHPVAAVLALESAKAAAQQGLVPRQPKQPGHLTSL
ncbi:MAG: hypothetical protein HOV92_21070, partial [Streptomyces sp.]|nr:hypothetical protein [Streptomyces sp.]